MPATVHGIARFAAKAGQEDELQSVLTALIPRVAAAMTQAQPLVEAPPDVRR